VIIKYSKRLKEVIPHSFKTKTSLLLINYHSFDNILLILWH